MREMAFDPAAVAIGCCEGEDMHAPTERIRADSMITGAEQLRAVLAEILEGYQEC
jgi:acetylornithine deacetylase/succinyl-diaminopimelate desuccinylase-like protein